MGVAYSHGIFVKDLSWRPTWRHIEAILGVLTKWGFADDATYVGDDDELDETAARAMPNMMVVLGGPEGRAAAKIMGRSIYKKLADEDRYIVHAELHVGSDFKVLARIEGAELEVTQPPLENGRVIEPEEDSHPLPPAAELYRASWSATPPRTDSTEEFDGVWRCGLILDCDKDVPAIAEPMSPLPASGFVRELEAAFGTKLVECGWYC